MPAKQVTYVSLILVGRLKSCIIAFGQLNAINLLSIMYVLFFFVLTFLFLFECDYLWFGYHFDYLCIRVHAMCFILNDYLFLSDARADDIKFGGTEQDDAAASQHSARTEQRASHEDTLQSGQVPGG